MIFHANLANIVQAVGKSFPSNPVFSCQLSTETLRGRTGRASLHAFHRFSISPILRGKMGEIIVQNGCDWNARCKSLVINMPDMTSCANACRDLDFDL